MKLVSWCDSASWLKWNIACDRPLTLQSQNTRPPSFLFMIETFYFCHCPLWSVTGEREFHRALCPCTVRKFVADFAMYSILTDDGVAKLYVIWSLVKKREMVENFVT